MKAIKIFAFLILAFLFSACPIFNNDYHFEYNTIVGTTPVNLEQANTAYDDYNSNLPYEGFGTTLFFSSNRNSSGVNFDIIPMYANISYHEKDDAIDMDLSYGSSYEFEKKLLNLANTASNQLGPLFLEGSKGMNYFFYASDDSGQFDIQLVYTPRSDWAYNGQKRLFGPVNLKGVNSDADDYYPTLNVDFTQMWFCSNSENDQFDIYSVPLNPDEFFYETLNKPDLAITKEEVLSGDSDDKCPILFGDYMIFPSNRHGGFGGFDLYYSQVDNTREFWCKNKYIFR